MKRSLTIASVALIIFAAGGIWFANNRPLRADEAVHRNSLTVSDGTIVSTVKATNALEPATELALSFETTGVVEEVLVERGQFVHAGEPIARIKSADLQLQLDQANANLAKLVTGSQPEDIAAAQASLASAQANYDKVAMGATAEDLAAAHAALASAKANYQALLDGPDDNELTVAAATLRSTEIALENAQSDYDKVAYVNNIGELPQSAALQQATIDYEAAKANYQLAVEAASDAELASTWSQVVQAQSQLDTLKSYPTAEDLAAAQAQVDQAQAQLEKLLNGTTAEDLAVAQIQVEQAELALSKATLKAPADGTITSVNIDAGEAVATGSGAVIILANVSNLHVDVQIDEIDLPAVEVGQAATVTLDALPDGPLAGIVTAIAPAPAASTTGATNYEVTVTLAEQPAQARVGMTANVAIETERRAGVVVLPAEYIQVDVQSGQTFVETRASDGRIVQNQITLGLRSGDNIEVLSGLQAGDEVLIPLPTEATSKADDTFFGGQRPDRAAQEFQNN